MRRSSVWSTDKWVIVLLGCLVAACGDSAADVPGTPGGSGGLGGSGGSGGTGGVATAGGFVFSEMRFVYRDEGAGPGVVEGIDIDGTASEASSPTMAECAHDDFESPSGTPGIDHAFLNMIDMFEGLQANGILDTVMSVSVTSGAMTILLELQGLDDMVNDSDVGVQVFSSESVPMTGPGGEVVAGTTLDVHEDTSLHSAVVNGELVDGVLEVGPVDIRWTFNIMIVDDVFFLRDAFLRIQINEDGTISGLMTGYWSVEDFTRIIITPTTENGNAAGFTFEEATSAIAQVADGDPVEGVCTTMSTAFEFSGVPAFLVK